MRIYEYNTFCVSIVNIILRPLQIHGIQRKQNLKNCHLERDLIFLAKGKTGQQVVAAGGISLTIALELQPDNRAVKK